MICQFGSPRGLYQDLSCQRAGRAVTILLTLTSLYAVSLVRRASGVACPRFLWLIQSPSLTLCRPFQRDIITAALEGHDVFVQAATSFGKSLCYQLPAVIDHGITIVISPLLALMNNQVAALRNANIRVETLNSNTPASERSAIIDDLRCGNSWPMCCDSTDARNFQVIH